MITQLNSIYTKLMRETKVEQYVFLINIYDIDIQAALINWSQFKSCKTFSSLFDSKVELTSLVGHNSHKNPPY